MDLYLDIFLLVTGMMNFEYRRLDLWCENLGLIRKSFT